MKTNEFIKKLDEHYYEINGLYTKYLFQDVFERTIDTDQFSITYRSDVEPNELIKIIAEYLDTPVKERKEEKRYYLRLKGFTTEEEIYLCAYDFWTDFLLIDKNMITHDDEFYFKFTEENINNLPEEIKAHNWEYVEVTDHENK